MFGYRESFINLVRDRIQSYPEETIQLGTHEVRVSAMTKDEVEALAHSVSTLLHGAPNLIVEHVAHHFDLLIDVTRSIKMFSHSPYQGIASKEKGLQILRLTPDLFTTVWGSTDVTSWEHNINEAGTYDYIGSASNPESTAEEEGLVIFGFIDSVCRPEFQNGVPESPVKRIALVKDQRSRYFQDLSFELCEGYPYVPLEEPFLVLPESSFYIRAKCAAGSTRLQPFGFKIMMRTEIAKMFE